MKIRKPVHAAFIPLLALAACESQKPPAACGVISPVTVSAGKTATVTACFNDPNGDALVYSAVSSNPAVATVGMSGSTVTVAAVAKGTTRVTVTAEDPGGLAATQKFQATVPNRAPEAGDPIPDRDVFVGDTATVDASRHFADPDGDALTFAASTPDASVAQVSVSGKTVRIVALSQGSATVTVTSTDSEGLSSAELIFAVTVPNRAPQRVGAIPAQTVLVGDSPTLDASPFFDDPDGDPLAFAASSSNTDVVEVSVTGSILSAVGVRAGSATVTVTATDPGGLSARTNLPVMVVTEGATTNLTSHSAADLHPRWSADGAKIAFTSERDGDAEIYVMDADGSGVKRLTDHTADDRLPAWSPDSAANAKIVFESQRDDNWEIYVMDADGSGVERLTDYSSYDISATWSPDGAVIAFASLRDGRWDIYSMEPDGSDVTNLTDSPRSDASPAWSPDGTKIAFVRYPGRTGDIYAMDADGGGVKRLTDHSVNDWDPAWSPDGAKIAFTSHRNGNADIYVMNADGSGVKRLTKHSADDRFPAWSPDGAEIAFMSERDGNWEIYVIDVF